MAKVNPSQAASKWSRRLSAATEDIRAGIESVTESPGKKAAAKRQKWETGVRNAADKWQRNVGNVTVDEWKQKALNVGLPRIAQGAQANEDKFESFAAEFFPHLDRGVAQIKNMPDVTMEDRINRSVAMMRHNASFRRGGGS